MPSNPPRRYAATILLAAANTAVFAAATYADIYGRLALTGDIALMAAQPWRLLTSMFLQARPLHFAINTAILIAAGVWYQRHNGRGSGISMTAIYMLGGLCAGLVFLATCHVAGAQSATLSGSSASVLAVIGAILGDRRRPLPGGALIAAVLLAVAATGIAGPNPGGAMAHVTGLMAGFIAGRSRRPRPAAAAPPDPVVYKAQQSGYSALTDEERRHLFNKNYKHDR